MFHQGSRSEDDQGGRRLPSCTTLEAMAAWKVDRNVRLTLNVRNLANRRYAIDADYAPSGGNIYPGRPRSYVLSGDFSF